MNDAIFREYDIRGIVDTELIIDKIYDLTNAIAYYFKQQNPSVSTIVVGMDGRTHSLAIKQEMCKALIDSGLNVLFIGVCSSPALYFALHTMPVDAGLMITASHNSKEYNGIKICLGMQSVWGTAIKDIQTIYHNKQTITSLSKGSYSEYPVTEQYCLWLTDHFSHIKNLTINAIIDCGNGAAGTIMPQLIEQMHWHNVQLLYPEVDGTYPHHEADPTVEKNMMAVKQLLATTDATIGIGIDGDCDRMAAMTKEGFLIPGDQLLAVFAQPIIKKHPATGVVFDIKSSGGLYEIIQKWGGNPIMSPSGHAIIKEYMHKNNALIGGELSCHFVFKDRYFGYDDGIYALLRLFERLHESGKTIEQLIKDFPHKYSSREFRIFCKDSRKQSVVDAITQQLAQKPDVSLITIDGVRAAMSYGWGIVRPSNTQPALSIRFEGNSAEGLRQVKTDFIDLLQPHLPDADLTQIFFE